MFFVKRENKLAYVWRKILHSTSLKIVLCVLDTKHSILATVLCDFFHLTLSFFSTKPCYIPSIENWDFRKSLCNWRNCNIIYRSGRNIYFVYFFFANQFKWNRDSGTKSWEVGEITLIFHCETTCFYYTFDVTIQKALCVCTVQRKLIANVYYYMSNHRKMFKKHLTVVPNLPKAIS